MARIRSNVACNKRDAQFCNVHSVDLYQQDIQYFAQPHIDFCMALFGATNAIYRPHWAVIWWHRYGYGGACVCVYNVYHLQC